MSLDNLNAQASDPSRRRDPLLAMLATNALWGAGLGILFVVGVIALDLGHLRQLLTFSADGALALALLSVGSIVTFASVAMGSAVMMLGKKSDAVPRSGLREMPHFELVPVTVLAKPTGVMAKRTGRSAPRPLGD